LVVANIGGIHINGGINQIFIIFPIKALMVCIYKISSPVNDAKWF
jgi:hypothetical protein